MRRRRRYRQSGTHPWGHVGWAAVGVKHVGTVETDPADSQQRSPDLQHAVPQHTCESMQIVPSVHGLEHVPPPQ